jgi:hypothetical protein
MSIYTIEFDYQLMHIDTDVLNTYQQYHIELKV